MKTATATAHSNIALVKYWGKRDGVDPVLNLPAVGSLSMTLDSLRTVTRVASAADAAADAFFLDEAEVNGRPAQKVFAQLDRLWAAGHAGPRPACRVVSTNHLPTAAGLASSASGFAALTVAAAHAFELDAPASDLSAWARMGSGSAARSIFGGFVRLERGSKADGTDCVARPLAGVEHWPLKLVVVQTTKGAKPIGSTEGMQASRDTSPYYGPWVDTSEADLDEAQAAIAARDLARLGAVVEHSCFKMHACMMATVPPIVYWKPASLAVIHEVWAARKDGLLGYVTMDAGPHVKILCAAADAEAIAARCKDVPGVEDITICGPGPDASVEVSA
ncbi:MAG: diphosphomevalonate decarboxylase [Myxococcota bacterium]